MEANALLKGAIGGFDNVMNPGINFAATKAYMAINARRVKGAPMDNPLHLYLAHQQGAGRVNLKFTMLQEQVLL